MYIYIYIYKNKNNPKRHNPLFVLLSKYTIILILKITNKGMS